MERDRGKNKTGNGNASLQKYGEVITLSQPVAIGNTIAQLVYSKHFEYIDTEQVTRNLFIGVKYKNEVILNVSENAIVAVTKMTEEPDIDEIFNVDKYIKSNFG